MQPSQPEIITIYTRSIWKSAQLRPSEIRSRISPLRGTFEKALKLKPVMRDLPTSDDVERWRCGRDWIPSQHNFDLPVSYSLS